MKRRMTPLALILILAWLLTLSVIVYTRRPPKPNEFPTISSEQPHGGSAEDFRLIRAELQVMRDYNDDFLNTIHWSLYTVLIVASLLIGANLFSSFRMADREREALKQELQGWLQGETALIRQEQQQGALQGIIESSKLSTRINSTEYEVNRLRDEASYLERDFLVFKAEQRLAQGDNQGAIAEYSKLLVKEIDSNHVTALSDLLRSISNALEHGAMPTAHVRRKITESLNRLPTGFEIESEKILEQLRRH